MSLDTSYPALARVQARHHTLVDAAAEELLRFVTRGDVGVGDRLPPERVLIAELGVSRSVLREALSSLEALGVVESRSTRGRFVAAGNANGERSRLLVSAWLNQHAGEIVEAMEVRAVIEPQAILGLTDDELPGLLRRARAVLERQAAAIESGDALAAAAENQLFHRQLCEATPNALLRALAVGLVDHSRRAAYAIYSDEDGATASLAEHRAIVEALAGGDRAEAARLDADHMLAPLRRRTASRDGTASLG